MNAFEFESRLITNLRSHRERRVHNKMSTKNVDQIELIIKNLKMKTKNKQIDFLD